MPERFYSVYTLRSWLMLPPVLFALFCGWGEDEQHWPVLPVGITLFLFGLSLRLWAQMALHYRLKTHTVLTTSGPYALCRNPIYVGNTVLIIGYVVMAELVWLAPFVFLYCAAIYTLVVKYEEAHLLNKYGRAFEQYVGEVPRWLPVFRSSRNISLPRWRHFLLPSILAEIHCLFFMLLALAKELLMHRGLQWR